MSEIYEVTVVRVFELSAENEEQAKRMAVEHGDAFDSRVQNVIVERLPEGKEGGQ